MGTFDEHAIARPHEGGSTVAKTVGASAARVRVGAPDARLDRGSGDKGELPDRNEFVGTGGSRQAPAWVCASSEGPQFTHIAEHGDALCRRQPS